VPLFLENQASSGDSERPPATTVTPLTFGLLINASHKKQGSNANECHFTYKVLREFLNRGISVVANFWGFLTLNDLVKSRHSGENRSLYHFVGVRKYWIPASAGMTEKRKFRILTRSSALGFLGFSQNPCGDTIPILPTFRK
jgi:hypothetical protein